MVWLAFSLQDQVDKYGTYVGFAAFVGLAILSLLYASQAREVKRLREWAGRAPERAAEVEAQAIANAEAMRREPAPPVAASRVVAQPRPAGTAPAEGVAAAAGAGAGPQRAAEAAASAFAAAGGVTTALVHPPAEAPASTNGANGAAPPAAPPESPAQAADTGDVPVLPASTPAARRAQQPDPAPAPADDPPRERVPAATLASSGGASSRPAPARRAYEGPDDTLAPRRSTTSWLLLGGVAVLVVVVAVFAGTQLFGSSADDPQPGSQTGGGGGDATATPTRTATAAPTPDDAQTRVVVLNATQIPRLALNLKNQLLEDDFRSNHVAAANLTVASPQTTSNVYYVAAADRARAQAVAKALRINGARLANGDVVTRANSAYQEGGGAEGDPQVIVVVGADKDES